MGKQLVIAEKPSAGKAIAKVLGVTDSKDGYIESDRYVVSWAFGHLIRLGENCLYITKRSNPENCP